MKILFPLIIGNSGSDVWVRLMAKGLREEGIDTEVVEIPHYYQYFPWLARRFIAARKSDLIHTLSWNGFAFAGLSPQVTTVQLCVHGDGLVNSKSFSQLCFHRLVYEFERKTFATAERVVSVSRNTQEQISKHFGVDSLVIENGIKIPSDEELGEIGSRPSPFPAGTFNLLFVGSPTKRKGWDLLPQIMTQLGSQFHLTCCLTRLEKRLSSIELPQNMSIAGSVHHSELARYYIHADALLFPSLGEGLSLAIGEALAHGLPIIASSLSSIPEQVKHDLGGLLVADISADGFSQACRMIRQKPREEFSRFNRALAQDQFSYSDMLKKYLQLYESVLDRKRTTDTVV